MQQTMRAAEKLFSARAIAALFLSAVDHRAYAKLLAAILLSDAKISDRKAKPGEPCRFAARRLACFEDAASNSVAAIARGVRPLIVG